MTSSKCDRAAGSFPRQFVLAEDRRPVPSDWVHSVLHGWSLWHCPLVPVRDIVDVEGTRVGWLLGESILRSHTAGEWPISASFADPTFMTALESGLQDVGGKFVAILAGRPSPRVYTDAGGILSVTYNAIERTVASSLALARSARHADTELIDVLDIPRRDRFFPFGLTPDQRVRRLLPNHFLDLADFRPVRYWPRSGSGFCSARDADDVVAAIADRVRENVEDLATSAPLHLSLTAGRDSRIVLAAAHRLVADIECYTFRVPDPKAQTDYRVAAALARRFRFRHRAVSWVEPTHEDLQDWQDRTGNCVGGRVWRLASTAKQLAGPGIRLSGMCGEVGRCFYWRIEDLQRGALTAEEIVAKLRLPAHTRLHAEAERWLGTLPVTKVPDVLDLLYVEQRLGCWAGPQQYGQSKVRSVPPLCDRRIFDSMLSLPWEYRFSQRLASDVIARLWQELLQIPFNQEIGLQRIVNDVQKRVLDRLRSVRGRFRHAQADITDRMS